MPVYQWTGINRANVRVKGEMDAPNPEAVSQSLRRQRIEPKKIKKKPKDLLENVPMFQPKVTEKDIVLFTRQFATMIDAGLPLVQCLEILSDQADNKTFKTVLQAIKSDVEGGATFADALKKHPKVFDDLFVNLVAAGEVGGILDTILNRLAVYIEKSMKLKKKVKSALVYPMVVSIVGVGVVAVLLLFVIPVFEKMFVDMGQALPGPTQVIVDLSKWLRKYILFIIALGIVLFITYNRLTRNDRVQEAVDEIKLRIPIFGDLIRKVSVARFTRTLGTMIQSGVPILDGLDIVAKTAGNLRISRAINETRSSIAEGKTLAEPLGEHRVFPSMVIQMISVGESTGALDAMLTKIADFYDEEVDSAVDSLTSLIEPVMIVFLGGVVGGFLVAMYLPIFQIAGAIE